MALTLYTYPQNPRAAKSQIAAQYAGIQLDIAANFEMGKTNESPEFLAKFPLGKVPVLDTPHGPIFESNAMARYVAGLRSDNTLLGTSHYESGQVDQWVYWSQNDLDAPAGLVCYSLLGYIQYNKKNYDQGKQDLHGSLDFINKHLADKTFLVGERITLADISVACSLLLPFKMVLDPATRAKFQNVTRWFTTLINQPQFIAVLGEVVLAAQEQQPGGAAAAAAPKKEEKKKEEKPKEAPKPKEEKKKAAKEDDDDDEPAAKEEKPRLSEEETAWIAKKSPMDLENVKRLFSNNKFEDIINQFWTEFDHSTFTIYECCYNYNEDNTIEWLTANLMGGFIQRLEEARKVSYGTITMAGNKPFYVQGVFMFKYKEVPTFVKECPDYESYTFKPLDATTDAGKQRFAEIWNGPTIDGRELKERRQFK